MIERRKMILKVVILGIIGRIKDVKENITMETEEIQRIIKSYFKYIHSTKLENLKGTD